MADAWQTIRAALATPLLVGALALAEPTGAVRQAGDSENWITQLAADDWKVRQQAEDRLVAVGEEALPRLAKLAGSAADGEVRTRAQSAMARIEQERITGKSLVTMDLKDATAAEALAELARQARAPIPTDPPNLLGKTSKRVSLRVDHKPFWEVMQSFSAQTGLEVAEITRHNREIGLGLTQGGTGWMEKPIALSGPLLIRADRLSRISTARLKAPGGVSEEFNISLTAFAEPKLRVLDYSGTLRLREVVDERGNSLIPPEDGAGPANVDVFGNARDGNTCRWEVGATLHRPKGAGTRIRRFSASCAVQVQTRSAVLEAPMAGARNAERVVDGLRMAVKTLDAGRCEVAVFRDGRSETEWLGVRLQLYAGEARLMGEQGQVLARGQRGVDADDSPDNQRMDVRIKFAREGPDEGIKDVKRKGLSEATKLQWEFPTEVRELVVPFEFHDLPIP
jgi:hypothetical protein